jgi:hypothetical protein
MTVPSCGRYLPMKNGHPTAAIAIPADSVASDTSTYQTYSEKTKGEHENNAGLAHRLRYDESVRSNVVSVARAVRIRPG